MANPAVLKIQYFNGKLEFFFSWQNGSTNRFFYDHEKLTWIRKKSGFGKGNSL